MPAANTDKFIKSARRWTGQVGSGGVPDSINDTIPLNTVTNLPVVVTIDRVDSNGNVTLSKEEGILGVVSGSNIISCVRGFSGTAQSHASGAVVEVRLLSAQWDRMIDGILADHEQDGSHKSGIILENPIIRNWDGWMNANETWTYASATTFTVSGDVTGKYQKGDKIKLTNSTVKYFYIVSLSYSSPNTIITVTGETDLSNSAITSNYYSKIENPQGFKRGELYYKASATNGSDQLVNDFTWAKAALGSEVYDLNNNYDTSSYRYTAPVSGYYEISVFGKAYHSGHLLCGNSGMIRKNGAEIFEVISHVYIGADAFVMSFSRERTIYLNKGDYIELYLNGDSSDGSQVTYPSNNTQLQIIFRSI